MLSDKEIVLQVVDYVGKWDVMLAGIKGNEVLIVSKKECPTEVTIDGNRLMIRRYDPENYVSLLYENDNVFRDYKIFYFVKVYMRKILDLLASLEAYRLSMDFKTSE
ncbi:hypothetical protein GWK48_01450 [Metallosphaera tengchongensis]|uniref:Uncharacterized protein n=1 Tax=Metallosphaera tengchongensis TaxID=1532350 RepID=A0A6N0NYP5_9CREN|nr:hypothetical protein GWK48_01450 [Metallosphaera tengchongensis]